MTIKEADLHPLLEPIEDEAAYDLALEAETTLGGLVREDADHPLGGAYRALLSNIAAYEERTYPTPAVPPHEVLAFLMQEWELGQAEIAELLDVDHATASGLLDGKLPLTPEQIGRLSRALGISRAVFLPD